MSAMNDKDYYAILGVSKDADKREIQKAFQQKARKLHPDVNKAPDAEERFKEVSEAYAVLSDEQKRARYDAMRSGSPFSAGPAPAQTAPYGGGFGGFPFGFPFDMGGRRAGRGQAYNPEEGADVVIEVDLTREQAREGARRGVKYRRYESCDNCHGSGSVATEHASACPTCGGSGSIYVDMASLFGMGRVQMVCPECGGSGKVVADPCPACGGSGRKQVFSEAVIEFPEKTHDGDTVRLAGMGHAGTNGAKGGDLVGRARVKAERLEGRGRTGFSLIGGSLPFLVLAAIAGVLPEVAPWCIVAEVVGIVLIAADDVLHRSLLWWRRGLQAVAASAVNNMFWALIIVWMVNASMGIQQELQSSIGGTGAAGGFRMG